METGPRWNGGHAMQQMEPFERQNGWLQLREQEKPTFLTIYTASCDHQIWQKTKRTIAILY